MKLFDSFFIVNEISTNSLGFNAQVALNTEHIIFNAHFPGHPITPGVIQIQIVHELLEFFLGQHFKLKEILACKFLNILNPKECNTLIVQIEIQKSNNVLYVKSSGTSNMKLIFKLNSTYKMCSNK